jgi:competence protein CoiA
MLTSLSIDGQKVIAQSTEKKSGPFVCPECGSETILHKGRIKIHHFAHKPPVSCEYGKGESLLHMHCKMEIYNHLTQIDRLDCELEKPLGKVRPDIYIYSKNKGKAYAIEVQISTLTMDKIIYRTKEYAKLGIYVLWLSPYNQELSNRLYAPKSWEKWLHATYFGRVYYWTHGLNVTPIHFSTYRKWIEETTWYESGGYEQSAGGYLKAQKRQKRVIRGEAINIAQSFKPTDRDQWSGGDIFIPKCKILIDNQSPWWNETAQPAAPRQVWVTVNA